MKMSELCQIEKYKSPSDTPPKAASGGGGGEKKKKKTQN